MTTTTTTGEDALERDDVNPVPATEATSALCFVLAFLLDLATGLTSFHL